MPIVSVIVPIYNGKAYIHRCLDSVLSQTIQDFELIIVDDGSTDGSEIICDQYAQSDSRVRVIHKKNGGVSNARNAGLNAAIGEYVVFCDGDDYIRDDLIEISLREIQVSGADIASFQLKRLSLGGIKKDAQIELYEDVDLTKGRDSFLEDVVSWKTGGWQACRSMFRREIIHNNNIKFCETCHNYAEDLGFTLEFLLYAHKIIFIDEQLYIYDDLRESSMMNSNKKCRVDDVNEVSHYLYDKMKKVIDEKTIYRIHHQIIIHEIGNMYGCTTSDEFLRWDKEIRKIRNIEFFIQLNREYFKCSHKKTKSFGFRSQREMVDRYLGDLNMTKLRRAYHLRTVLLFCSRLKAKLIGR